MIVTPQKLAVHLSVNFVLVICDQILKYWAIHHSAYNFYLIKPWLGFELLLNPGVAFGLPVPNWALVIGTPFLLIALALFWWQKNLHPKTLATEVIGLVFIIAGALSNYADRLVRGVTVDYLRVLYSVLNLADLMIVFGLLLVVINHSQSPIDSSK